MSYKISKELFEAVVGFKVIEFYCKNEIQYYPADRERVRCIDWIPTLSGYEYNDFFFKCKEWALRQGGLTILSGTYKNTVEGFLQNKAYIGYAAIQYYVIDEYRTGTYCLKTYDRIKASCELQAVFDICQRILNNKALYSQEKRMRNQKKDYFEKDNISSIDWEPNVCSLCGQKHIMACNYY